MACPIPVALQHLGQRQLFHLHMPRIGMDNAIAIRVSARDTAPAGRRADGSSGVETVKTNSIPCHLVKMGSPEHWMAIVARVAPTLIIRHAQNDIRRSGRAVFGGRQPWKYCHAGKQGTARQAGSSYYRVHVHPFSSAP